MPAVWHKLRRDFKWALVVAVAGAVAGVICALAAGVGSAELAGSGMFGADVFGSGVFGVALAGGILAFAVVGATTISPES